MGPSDENGEMVVTPWAVTGTVDYEKLIVQFGVKPLTEDILDQFRRYTGQVHLQLRRKVFFAHRDLDWLLARYAQGEKFVLYTGRGPSGPVHIGHLVPWFFTKHLQDHFGSKLYFQMTDDEKFLIHPDVALETPVGYAYENALDLIAVGFDPKKTVILFNTRHIKALYEIALKVAKHITFSTVKATFGFQDDSNIGIIFFPAIQAAPAFLESALQGREVPCLIPAAIDQDPYWRVTRDIAPRLGFPKPTQIHCRFLPGLGKEGKMSASMPETAIFTTDPPEMARRKVMNAFTGGRATAEEQRRLGGNPEICPVFHYHQFFFEEKDEEVEDIRLRCKTGQLLCGECKGMLADKVEKFLVEHQRKREKAKDLLDSFMPGPELTADRKPNLENLKLERGG